MDAGILDASFEAFAIPIGNLENLEPGVAKVLEIYIDNSTDKLHIFDTLLEQIELFRQLINERFLYKKIIIARRDGYSLRSDKGYDIPLTKLSSGEQHRLVLLFELIFEVKKNFSDLIDEPELSLHVSWQRVFLDDIDRIIKLNEFDLVLAIHSPQLIARRMDKAIKLASVD